ncbi:MAG: SDR family oxidoreductase [Deinococcota bacterium]
MTSSSSKVAQQVAIVTGAGSGIGQAVAVGLLERGYSVVLAGRRHDRLQQTADAASNATNLVVPTNVSEPESVQNLFTQTQQTYGRLDLLFNNAGVNAPAVPLEDLAFADWQRVINVNLTGAFLCTQQAFKLMKTQTPLGGRIINNGSISAYAPRPNTAPYTASKHAMTGLTKSTSLDGRKYNIACGQIDIGNADTELAEKMKTGILQANGTVMAEPMMDVHHVAAAVIHMASLPLTANVQFMTVMATAMPLLGRG